jgi:hypothetical protein
MDKQELIKSWIQEYQKDKWNIHEICRSCKYPHSNYVCCGSGATFGKAMFGGFLYAVDSSNVDYYVHLREIVAIGHHWQNDVYFYTNNGYTVIRYIKDYNGHPNIHEFNIPALEWLTITEQVNRMNNELI